MAVSISVQKYLNQKSVDYDLLSHPHTTSAARSAVAAKVPNQQMAKTVVLEGAQIDDVWVAVVPATHRVEMTTLSHTLNQPVKLVTEKRLKTMFKDCDFGAIPPFGQVYGYQVIMDEKLARCDEVYFEGGDHTDLVHVKGYDFRRLMEDVATAKIS